MRRPAAGVAVATLVGLAAMPAAALAGPVEDAVRQAVAEPPAGAAVERIAPAVRETTARVEPVVRAATDAEPVGSTLDAVAGPEPVRSTARAIAQPAERVAPGATAAAASVAERPEATTPSTSSPHRAAIEPSPAGGIDREAKRRSGDDLAAAVAALGGAAMPLTVADTPLDTRMAATERARTASSSTTASGEDGFDVGSPFGHDGGASLGGPAGVALLALLGLLAGALLLAPRFFTRLLSTSPARWGPAAFHSPIERPG